MPVTGVLAIDQWQILIRLVIAAGLGALIGFERERQDQPAGLRTHMILAIGAALAMIISINIAQQYKGDAGRIAAQVISGIGFLGAAAIFRFGWNVRGLTTATSLWTLAIIGMAVGAGHFLTGFGATVLILIALTFMNSFEKRFIIQRKHMPIEVCINDRPGILQEIKKAILDQQTTIVETSVNHDLERDVAIFNLVVVTTEDAPIEQMIDNLMSLKGVKSFKIG